MVKIIGKLTMFNRKTVGFSTIKDEISTKRMDLNGTIFSSEWIMIFGAPKSRGPEEPEEPL
jgi:hypothetical protein